MVQSRYWTSPEGLVFVTRADGTTFKANPAQIGVESELYTRFGDENKKDTVIEEWFARTIDGPAKKMIEHLLDPANVSRRPLQRNLSKTEKVRAREIGFRINPFIDEVHLPTDIRKAISQYLAALLVRNPTYLEKLINFHKDESFTPQEVKNHALDKMLNLYSIYAEKIESSVFMITKCVESTEYLYADGGIIVEEPWRTEYGIPFDIHAPLTPGIAIQVLPIPDANDLSTAMIGEFTNRGVARQNRIILGGAKRFVFSRKTPPLKFIQKNFGKPAPQNIGYRIRNGSLETIYDPSRT
jgi:Protein of unknown function (DUF4238)